MCFRRLLKLRREVSTVIIQMDQNSVDNLSNTEWNLLSAYCDLLGQFSDVTHQIEGDQYTTISLALPYLKSLEMFLDRKHGEPGFRQSSTDLKRNLVLRFSPLRDPGDPKFDPFYCAATFLHPPYQRILSQEQARKAKEYIQDLLDKLEADNPQDGEQGPAPEAKSDSGLLSNLSSLVRRKSGDQSQAVTELDLYCKTDPEIMEGDDPVEGFWLKNQGQYPKLYQVALDILACPATSAPSERAFSQCTIATKGFKGAISDEKLERTVMLKMNKKLIDGR